MSAGDEAGIRGVTGCVGTLAVLRSAAGAVDRGAFRNKARGGLSLFLSVGRALVAAGGGDLAGVEI